MKPKLGGNKEHGEARAENRSWGRPERGRPRKGRQARYRIRREQ